MLKKDKALSLQDMVIQSMVDARKMRDDLVDRCTIKHAAPPTEDLPEHIVLFVKQKYRDLEHGDATLKCLAAELNYKLPNMTEGQYVEAVTVSKIEFTDLDKNDITIPPNTCVLVDKFRQCIKYGKYHVTANDGDYAHLH